MSERREKLYRVVLSGRSKGTSKAVTIISAQNENNALEKAKALDKAVIAIEEPSGGNDQGTIYLNKKEQLDFLKSLNALISSGLPLQKCIELLPSLFREESNLQEVSLLLLKEIISGNNVGDSLSNRVRGFPSYITRSISISSSVGSLKSILPHLIEHYGTDQETRQQVVNSLLYPSFIIILVFLATLLISFNKEFITSLFAPLTNPSLIEQNINALINGIWILIIFITGLLSLPLLEKMTARLNFSRIARLIERFRFLLPPFGNYIRERKLGFYFSLMAIMFKSGLTLEQTLAVMQRTTGSYVFDESVEVLHSFLKQGESLRIALHRIPDFPDIVHTWLGIGEITNDMQQSVNELSLYFKSRTKDFERKIQTIVEPLTIVFAGVIVLMFVILIVLPLLTSFGNIL